MARFDSSGYARPTDGHPGAMTRLNAYHTFSTGAAVVLDHTYPEILKIIPTGAHRDVTLDPVATAAGLLRRITNQAGSALNLVCKNVGGDTIATLNQNDEGEFYCDGATWALVRVIATSAT